MTIRTAHFGLPALLSVRAASRFKPSVRAFFLPVLNHESHEKHERRLRVLFVVEILHSYEVATLKF